MTPPIVFFAASKIGFDGVACEPEFTSTLFGLGVLSGLAAADLDGSPGYDEKLDLGKGKVTGLYARDGNLYVSTSGGLSSSGGTTVYGDGEFSDPPDFTPGNFAVQIFVDYFRYSPF